MRFLKDGPSIPDELLIARDEGRVIYFCGAGVSRARANLPDFAELAERVMETLGATADSPARRLLLTTRKIEPIAGVGGLVSADRVFGLLEREFLVSDIMRAVAVALKPKRDADVSAHRILLDLARSPDRKVRIVTTNFDLLFEACTPKLARWGPQQLPDPTRQGDFTGIVHLHGHVDDSYEGAAGDGLVLSSAEFGRAYLSEGWATQFIRAVLNKYLVVFVGYAAEDPPVQYLLEALNRAGSAPQGLYAFQPGLESEVQSMWLHKGVQAIAYESKANHSALWETLEVWAGRARSPSSWSDKVIRRARLGPEVLMPHERGQTVHLVSTLDGARRFASAKRPPPAAWLCVFDPASRYAKPGRLNVLSAESPFFDPFESYCLDTDEAPIKIESANFISNREIPTDARDVFVPTKFDEISSAETFSSFRGNRATVVPGIPSRLDHLAIWLARVADQPAAVWWAAGQGGLHPDVQMRIRLGLQRIPRKKKLQVRKAWRYLFEGWETRSNGGIPDTYSLQESISQNGWDALALRSYTGLHRPRLKVTRPFWTGPRAPESSQNMRMSDLVSLEVEYPWAHVQVAIPDELLTEIVPALRQNLEHAVALETELGGFPLSSLPPIEPDPNLAGTSSIRDSGVSQNVLSYLTHFQRLLDRDPVAGKNEYLRWRANDAVFERLRIWAVGNPMLTSDAEAGTKLISLNQREFWHIRHQRDLLLSLAKRWPALTNETRVSLEKRILKGPPRRTRESTSEFRERRAGFILNRLYWLERHGCRLSFDIEAKAAPLRAAFPQWHAEHAENAAASMEARGGYVHTDSSHADLMRAPLPLVLAVAAARRLREHSFLLRYDPFAGLATERPVRALGAIRLASNGLANAVWAWQTFLDPRRRKSDRSRFITLVALRMHVCHL